MAIQIKYFASLRDRLGRSEDELPAGAATTVGEVWQRLFPDTPLPPNILTAVNLEYAGLDHPVADGDEIAFFPPVTGG
jgi:molybdopterin synthase sulfur carrier subunit